MEKKECSQFKSSSEQAQVQSENEYEMKTGFQALAVLGKHNKNIYKNRVRNRTVQQKACTLIYSTGVKDYVWASSCLIEPICHYY